MVKIDRRSALSLGLAAATLAVAAPAFAQAPPGVSRQSWGKRESMLPGYKSVAMRDVIYQPGAKTSSPSMPNDMVCHVPEGELRVKQTDGMEFDLRRSAVRHMEQAGVPRSVAMKLTGHKTENVYRRYAIVSDADLDSAAQKLAAAASR